MLKAGQAVSSPADRSTGRFERPIRLRPLHKWSWRTERAFVPVCHGTVRLHDNEPTAGLTCPLWTLRSPSCKQS